MVITYAIILKCLEHLLEHFWHRLVRGDGRAVQVVEVDNGGQRLAVEALERRHEIVDGPREVSP
jgi:hypothetical protein